MSTEVRQVWSLITDVAIWTAILPLLVGVIRFRDSQIGFRAITVLMAVALLVDNLMDYYGNKSLISEACPRIYTVVEFTLISIFFIKCASRKLIKKFMILAIFIFVAVAIVDFVSGGLKVRDNIPIALECLLVVLYSMSTLYLIMRDAVYPNILAAPQFWIISGLLFYFGGNIFVFITSNYIAQMSRDAYTMIWGIHAILCFIFYVLLTVGLWKAKNFR